ncbi:MAG: phage distal tail protein, Rcc01695 family [Bacteroidota bacterium]
MSFIDARFPVGISYGSAGGPVYQTAVVSMRSGRTKRNINWQYPRHEYDAAVGVRKMSDLEDLIAFFHVVQGKARSFRWKDWADYKSCKTAGTPAATDQQIGTGDGSTVEYQLIKNYSFGGNSRSRNITKPVSGTVLVACDAASTTAFTLDKDTGKITFDTTTWVVEAVDTAADWVAVSGDKTGDIADGSSIEITGSTGNDGVYTVDSTNYDSGNDRTEIHTDESISDSTADGSVKYGQPSTGVVITAGYEFDVHCMLDSDELPVNLDDYQAGSVEVPVLEIKQDL